MEDVGERGVRKVTKRVKFEDVSAKISAAASRIDARTSEYFDHGRRAKVDCKGGCWLQRGGRDISSLGWGGSGANGGARRHWSEAEDKFFAPSNGVTTYLESPVTTLVINGHNDLEELVIKFERGRLVSEREGFGVDCSLSLRVKVATDRRTCIGI